MPRNFSGVYSKPAGTTPTNGDDADATQFNLLMDDMTQALTDSLPRDGSAPMTGALAMGSNKITGLAAAVDGADAVSLDGARALAAAPNLVRNGSGIVNQRNYISGTATSGANQFTLDRWFVIASGQSLTFTGAGAARVMTAPAGGVAQVIEGLNVEGGTYVLNWAGTATAKVNGGARTKGESFTLTANANVTIAFYSGTFSKVKAELGSVVTQYAEQDYGSNLAACKRYYKVFNWLVSNIATAASQDFYGLVNFDEMRATPTIVKATGTFTNCTDPIAPVVTSRTYTALVRSAASGTLYAEYTVRADAELIA